MQEAIINGDLVDFSLIGFQVYGIVGFMATVENSNGGNKLFLQCFISFRCQMSDKSEFLPTVLVLFFKQSSTKSVTGGSPNEL